MGISVCLVCSVVGLGIERTSHFDLVSYVLRTWQFCVFMLHTCLVLIDNHVHRLLHHLKM